LSFSCAIAWPVATLNRTASPADFNCCFMTSPRYAKFGSELLRPQAYSDDGCRRKRGRKAGLIPSYRPHASGAPIV
jgi:hypothetical protein